MNINPDYLNDYGLINAKLSDINAENSPLWTLQYLLIRYEPELAQNLLKYVRSCYAGKPGLYHQSPVRHNNHDDYMSNDQLIAFVGALHLYGSSQEVDDVWRYLRNHLFTYNNLTGNYSITRPMHPKAWITSGVLAGSWFADFWLPVLDGMLIHSCATKETETSGKLKAWTIMKILDRKHIFAHCTDEIHNNEPFNTWEKVFCEYYQEDGQPIRELVKSNYHSVG